VLCHAFGCRHLQIIDYGLMASIEKREMDAMVRAIIDLANRRYDAVVRDFIALKFLDDDVDKVQVENVLSVILDQALEGGGAKSINFQTLSDELATVTFDFNFNIPPSFALLLRALSVLEGIALIGDPDFKLIMEAFPFVSRLILTDRSPALREALLDVLYVDGNFSPTRLRVLLDSSQGIINQGEAFVDFDTLSDQSSITKEAIDLLFSDDGLVLREILTDEIASGFDVLTRSVVDRTTSAFELALPTPIRGLVMSITGRGDRLNTSSSAGFTRNHLAASLATTRDRILPPVTSKEQIQLDNMRVVIDWLTEGGGDMGAAMRLLPEIAPKSVVLGRMVVGRMTETFAQRLFQDVIRGGGETVAGRRRVSLSALDAST
jgi:hypothetical protein